MTCTRPRVETQRTAAISKNNPQRSLIIFALFESPLQRLSTVDTQPQLQPALLRLSAMISQYFMRVRGATK
jgi:hypothetical protein